MSKYTSGPWIADRFYEDGLPVFIFTESRHLIGRAYVRHNPSIANARLIAAAPDLLESLKETRDAASMLCRIIVKHGLTGELEESYDGFGKRADQAIAKAEGK